MKRFVTLAISATCSIALLLSLCACLSSKEENAANNNDTQQEKTYVDSVSDDDIYASGIHHAKVKVKGYKTFTITLDADTAPITVSNFCKLAKSGFYDGLTFHRAVADFCLQGGDPNGDGTGGSSDQILGEFKDNNVTNKLADNYERGVVAMARGGYDNNSASSQFFITLSDDAAYSLNGLYAAFGTIDKAGMKIVDKITKKAVKKADQSMGTITKKSDQPVITSIKIVD